MKKILIGLAVLLLLSTAGYAAATWRGRQESAAQQQEMASSQAGNERLVAEGKVVPLQHAVLSLPTGGIVATMLVTEGDQVSALRAGLCAPTLGTVPHTAGTPDAASGRACTCPRRQSP